MKRPHAKVGDPCPICGDPMQACVPTNEKRRSRDHILPQSRGGRDRMYGDASQDESYWTRNLRTICQGCNTFRGMCDHCDAVVACIRAVAASAGTTPRVIFDRWRLGAVMASEQRQRAVERNARTREKVRIGRIVARTDLDEFVWPADTAAKRVWNLATLGRGGR